MSRTNPYKKKRRASKKTILMFGEGFNDGIFLKHLRGIYSRNSGVQIKIQNGKGGTAYEVVSDACKALGAFDKRAVVVDCDKGEEEMQRARQVAAKKQVVLLENTPCLEFTLLLILESPPRGKTSKWYKERFESGYLDKKKRDEPKEYIKLFPQSLLDKKRTQITELNEMILTLEGNE